MPLVRRAQLENYTTWENSKYIFGLSTKFCNRNNGKISQKKKITKVHFLLKLFKATTRRIFVQNYFWTFFWAFQVIFSQKKRFCQKSGKIRKKSLSNERTRSRPHCLPNSSRNLNVTIFFEILDDSEPGNGKKIILENNAIKWKWGGLGDPCNYMKLHATGQQATTRKLRHLRKFRAHIRIAETLLV